MHFSHKGKLNEEQQRKVENLRFYTLFYKSLLPELIVNSKAAVGNAISYLRATKKPPFRAAHSAQEKVQWESTRPGWY